jgi:hypothetical protein
METLSSIVFPGVPVNVLAARPKPGSGKGPELREYEGIAAADIVRKVREL